MGIIEESCDEPLRLTAYAAKLGLPTASIVVRLDGLYGDVAPLLDVLSAHLGVIAQRVVPTICWIWKSSSRHLPASRLM